MDAPQSLPLSMKALAVCTLTLYLKFLVTTMIQGRKGFAAGTRVPEDNQLPMAKTQGAEAFDFRIDVPNDQVKLAIEAEMRWKRIIQNDLESMPMALAVFITTNFVGGNPRLNACVITVYTGARCAHTIAYATSRPLARMMAWMIGIVCILTAAVDGVYTVVTH
ncbi:TPA: hypothetical protein N0F65_003219 [Lagenidium giganteum]|uniref:Microsomal glutathione S-transferase 1 n=1 Tax=Lagenidium giganteum TaxID=4803 RepID=A0AAV2Z9Q4_9STRA|nr:TPA: hypothetical protein N0F65_003219 [Lagenidium giganteum]